jgi:DNA helicase HerA-like ATPase
MSIINIGIPIDLQKLLDTRMLVQAGSGGGKSYGLRKIIESIGNQVQQIVIDPEGEFVTLREKFDFALVSKGGDIPLNVKYAETLAHKILETGISVIIDLYEPSHDQRAETALAPLFYPHR